MLQRRRMLGDLQDAVSKGHFETLTQRHYVAKDGKRYQVMEVLVTYEGAEMRVLTCSLCLSRARQRIREGGKAAVWIGISPRDRDHHTRYSH